MQSSVCDVLGYNVNLTGFDEAVDFAVSKMEQNESLHIVTINPEIIYLADNNLQLADIIKNSELVLPESTGIILALKLKGIKQEKIPGIDYAKELIKKCSELNYPVALIGAKEHVVNKAVNNLKQEYKMLNIVYSHNGYFDNDEEIINKLKEKQPKLILCALGAPKQEIFINKCLKEVEGAVFIGIGGSFDVWANEVKRSPVIYQKLGLEWLYRTIKQPNRIKRIYKTLPMFLFRAIIEGVRSKK